MSACLEDTAEIFRATAADLAPNCYMGEDTKTPPPMKTCRVAVF